MPSKLISVALVITELNVGGAERCLTRLALGLDRQRFAPHVYALGLRPQGEQAALTEQLEQAGVPLQFIGVSHWRQFPRAVRLLTDILRQWTPHILQSFLFHANVVAALAAARSPVGAHVAGVRVAEPARWRLAVERWALRDAARVVCVSQSVADYCHTKARFAKEKLLVIPNGVDVDSYAPRSGLDRTKLGLPEGSKVLCFVGRLERQKGLDWLLAILPQVFQTLSDVTLVIVGDGPLRAQLEAQARRLGIGDRVVFLGWRRDIDKLLAASDVFVLPSRWEGMPNAVLEAMASGLPIVSTQAEGLAEALGLGFAHQTAPWEDDEAFVEKLISFCRDENLASKWGQANRRLVAERFSWEAVIHSYECLYASISPHPE